MEYEELQKSFMQEALNLAREQKGYTAPNPSVGAVVVRDGCVISRGKTAPVGGAHAEVQAIEIAGEACRGADLYVTLEPCSHWGKTPPCADAVIAAGFSRVFVAIEDPNPRVSGEGIARLRRAGLAVFVGLLKEQAYRINEDYFYYIQTNRPWVTVKLAQTLDGKIADIYGESKWITSAESRTYVHQLRAQHTAIAVGVGTLEKDNPQLTVRGVPGSNPIRIVFASHSAVGKDTWFRQHVREQRSIIVIHDDSPSRIEHDSYGIEHWYTGSADYSESFESFLEMAGREMINSLFIEGGNGIVRTAFNVQRVNRVYLFYAPKIIGGGVAGITFDAPLSMEKAITFESLELKQFGDDVMLTGIPQWKTGQ